MRITLDRQISAGHRIVGHQGKCARLHGHDYRFQVELKAEALRPIGFVADFADVKAIIDEWDHRLLLWTDDPIAVFGDRTDAGNSVIDFGLERRIGIVRVPFNPTAEHMAAHLAHRLVEDLAGIVYARVEVWETPQASAIAEAGST